MNDELEPLDEALALAVQAELKRAAPDTETMARVAERIDSTFSTTSIDSAPEGSTAGGTALGTKVLLVALGIAVGAVGGAQVQARFGTAPESPPLLNARGLNDLAQPVATEAALSAPPLEDEMPSTATETSVEDERRLIERAAAALTRGDGQAALEACELHRRHYGNGRLFEERESLVVRALMSMGRRADAQVRANVIRHYAPESIFLEGLDDALQRP